MSNIVLIGMRGSGKNTTGALLARKLDKHFIDTDQLIIEQVGKTIPEIVSTHGWKTFRQHESAVARDCSKLANTIIATGGGIIVNKVNVIHLRANAHVVLLTAPVDTLVQRIATDPNRPSLTSHTSLYDELNEVWQQRKRAYSIAADSVVDTANKTAEDVVQEILKAIGSTT